MTALAETFSDMRAADAIAACTPLPQRLLLHREVGTRAGRTAWAKRRAWRDALIGIVPAALVFVAARWIGAGQGTACSAAAATLAALVACNYRRRNSDPLQLFEQEAWIDFTQRSWHSRRSHPGTNLPAVDETIPLDALMLICARFLFDGRWTYDFGLCKRAEFTPASDQLPEWTDFLCSADTEEEAVAFSTTIARAWGIACWMHSAASDEHSRQLC